MNLTNNWDLCFFSVQNFAVPFRLTVKIGMQTLLTQVNKVSLVRCWSLFFVIVISRAKLYRSGEPSS